MLIGAAFAPVFASLVLRTPRWVGDAHAETPIGIRIPAAGLGGATLAAPVGFVAYTVGLRTIGGSVVVRTSGFLVVYWVLLGQRRKRRGATSRMS